MEEVSTNKSNTGPNIDVNNPDFYENVQTEIDSDLAWMKKTVEVLMNLRLTAAEVEVETAALYHAELWYDLLDLQDIPEEQSEEEEEDSQNDEEDVDNEGTKTEP